MALKKITTGYLFNLSGQSSGTIEDIHTFNPMDHLPAETETIEKIVYEVRVSQDPTSSQYYPQFYFNPNLVAGGTYEYPKHHPDNDAYLFGGDRLWWPTNQNDGPTVAYNPPLTAAEGIFAITHIPANPTYYLTNWMVLTGGIYTFDPPVPVEAQLELVSATIYYDGFKLNWDNRIDRYYETGIDRGMWTEGNYYGRPWPGLISVQENIGLSTEPVYYGGESIHHITNLGDYQATVKSFARPDSSLHDFHLFEGNVQIRPGVYFGGQAPRLFNFSWRSWIGNPVGGEEAAYKIHIVYNAIALPERIVSETENDQPNPRVLSWKIRSTAELTGGYAPTSKIVVDSRYTDPTTLSYLEGLIWDSGYFIDPNQIISAAS